MREAAILHTTAIEIFIGTCFQRKAGMIFLNYGRSCFFQYCLPRNGIDNLHQSCFLIDADANFLCFNVKRAIIFTLNNIKCRYILTGVIHQNLCRRIRLGITQLSSRIITEKAEDVISVKSSVASLLSANLINTVVGPVTDILTTASFCETELAATTGASSGCATATVPIPKANGNAIAMAAGLDSFVFFISIYLIES